MSGLAFFSVINGLHYLVLLNFISSGSLQDIEQALPLPCVCELVCVHIPTVYLLSKPSGDLHNPKEYEEAFEHSSFAQVVKS